MLSVVLLHLHMRQIPRACLSVWRKEGAFCVEHLAVFSVTSNASSQCDTLQDMLLTDNAMLLTDNTRERFPVAASQTFKVLSFTAVTTC